MRTSPIHVPRRDELLGRADQHSSCVSPWWIVTIPAPRPSSWSGGIGGPVRKMLVWPSQRYRGHQGTTVPTGTGHSARETVLWVGTGVLSPGRLGAFDIAFPTSTMAGWPRRCAYALQLDYDGGGGTRTCWPRAGCS